MIASVPTPALPAAVTRPARKLWAPNRDASSPARVAASLTASATDWAAMATRRNSPPGSRTAQNNAPGHGGVPEYTPCLGARAPGPAVFPRLRPAPRAGAAGRRPGPASSMRYSWQLSDDAGSDDRPAAPHHR